jgi:hypothetical protein
MSGLTSVFKRRFPNHDWGFSIKHEPSEALFEVQASVTTHFNHTLSEPVLTLNAPKIVRFALWVNGGSSAT